MDAEFMAKLFHENYEKLAPSFGYKTREASAKPWFDVPENNRKLMIAVAEKIITVQKKMNADGCVNDCSVIDANHSLIKAVAMLNSMVLSGESHTTESKKIVAEVMELEDTI